MPTLNSSVDVSLSPNSQLEIHTANESVKSLHLISDVSGYASEKPALEQIINAVRFLAADTVLHAQSGHTGMPMGMAPAACTLWDKHMTFSPSNPDWVNRDRFILSAGHGSALLYSLLYVFGFDESMSMEDLLSFRHAGSRAPGHPENVLTPGVEVTTGALGQGISNAVGFALAETHLASVYNRPGFPIIDHYTFVIVGDGCLMEGVSAEACSLAGHWHLGKLIVLYDDNAISIEGSTDLAFTEDVAARFDSYGWQVLCIEDGNTDIQAIHSAIAIAKADTERPTLIKISTTIGYGTPTLAGTAKIHGPCLDSTEIDQAKKKLGWSSSPFEIPHSVLSYARRKRAIGAETEKKWTELLCSYELSYPKLALHFKKEVIRNELPQSLDITISQLCMTEKKTEATRKTSGRVLNVLAEVVPCLLGGSADLGPSTVTTMSKCSDYQCYNRSGRNIHFGVREHAMGSISNGIALHGSGLIPYCSTFLVFTDYCRAAIRTAALSQARVLFILTHDSVLLGQDGPTHQPVEHLASLRAIPDLYTIRPAEQVEVATAYQIALERRNGPTCLILSRQGFKVPKGSRSGARHGAYIHSDNTKFDSKPELMIITSGSELGLVSEAAEDIRKGGTKLRIVSMLCMELFLEQSREYQDSVLCPSVCRSRRLVVEAGSSFGWYRFADYMLTIDSFGISATSDEIKDAYGLTKENVIKKAKYILLSSSP